MIKKNIKFIKMDKGTSSSIVMPENFEHNCRLSEDLSPWKLNSPVLLEDNENKVKRTISDSWYDRIDGFCYVDFLNGIPEPNDTFFDTPCASSPKKRKQSNLLTSKSDAIRLPKIEDDVREENSIRKGLKLVQRKKTKLNTERSQPFSIAEQVKKFPSEKLVKLWKQKPVQVSLLEPVVYISRSPQFRALKIARSRQLFEDILKEIRDK